MFAVSAALVAGTALGAGPPDGATAAKGGKTTKLVKKVLAQARENQADIETLQQTTGGTTLSSLADRIDRVERDTKIICSELGRFC